MSTIVMNAPRARVTPGSGLQTFDDMYKDGVGKGFILHKSEIESLSTGDQVILLSNDEHKRAVGKLKKVVPTEKANNGKQRYDVFFEHQRLATYEYTRLGRNGVAVL